MRLSVSSNIKEVTKGLSRLEREVIPQAAARSLNDTATGTVKQAVRDLSKQMPIKQKGARRGFKVIRARKKHLIAEIRTQGAAIPLIDFKGTRAVRAGVKSKAYGKDQLYKNAFIAKMPPGKRGKRHKGVFVNKSGNYSQRKQRGIAKLPSGKIYAKALPIKELWGPSLPAVFADKEAHDKATKFIRKTFPKRLSHNIRFLASRAR